MNRRSFLTKTFGALVGVVGLCSLSKAEKKKENEYKYAPYVLLQEQVGPGSNYFTKEVVDSILLNNTWDYSDDETQMGFIKGQPVRSYMFEVVSGYGWNEDLVQYFVSQAEKFEKDMLLYRGRLAEGYGNFRWLSPNEVIHPLQITKCNVKKGWVEYIEGFEFEDISINEDTYTSKLQPKKDTDGNVQYRKVYLKDMKVEVLNSETKVLCTLYRKDNKCWVEY